MKPFLKALIGILLIGIVLPAILIFMLRYTTVNIPKTIILPEEICQAQRGDHMQFYERDDTIFLEYTFARKPELQPEKQGQQVIVGENIDYRKDNLINVDTLKNLYKQISSIADSLKD